MGKSTDYALGTADCVFRAGDKFLASLEPMSFTPRRKL